MNVLKNRRLLIGVAVAVVAVLLVVGSLVTSGTGIFSQRKSEDPATPAAVKTGDPNQVAQADTDLLRVTEPPSNTRSRLSLTRDIGDAEFKVSFRPYGYGPDTGTLVLKLGKVTAEGGNDLAPKFAETLSEKNLVVRMAPAVTEKVRSGGAYAGTVKLAEDGDASVFVLTDAERSGE